MVNFTKSYFNMKMVLICLIGICTSLALIAQNNFTIIVYKENSNSIISGASILLPAVFKTAVTDTSGKAHFKNLPNGKYDVTISCAGYLSTEKSITLSENNSDLNVKNSII